MKRKGREGTGTELKKRRVSAFLRESEKSLYYRLARTRERKKSEEERVRELEAPQALGQTGRWVFVFWWWCGAGAGWWW